MNKEFEKNGYVIVKNLINRDAADTLCALTFKHIADGKAQPGSGRGSGEHPFTWNINAFSAFDPLLTLLTPKVSEILELDIVPTYYIKEHILKVNVSPH